MSCGDWDCEIDRAADWLWEKTCEAVDEAFPRGMLFGAAATGLKAPSTKRVFQTILRIKILDQFRGAFGGQGVAWDDTEPLRGEMLREVGVDGRFPSTPFLAALRAIGADEAIPYLKPGMHVTINPGAIVVHADFRSKGVRIEVTKSERNGDDPFSETTAVGVDRVDEKARR